MYSSIFPSLLVFFFLNSPGSSDPIMGPAEVRLKYTEKCKHTERTMIDMEFRLFTRRTKLILQSNFTLPFPFSDDMGYEANVAVKRNGGWKPNFMKFHGTGLCSILKTGDPTLYRVVAKSLKAPEPYSCPLPPGLVGLNYSGVDPTTALKKYGMEVMPYGELRLSANVTHKGDVIYCFRFYVDLVPKKRNGR